MRFLGIETSCDETAVAIVEGKTVLSSCVASQHDIHAKFGGVVPELASRRHTEMISLLLEQAFKDAKLSIDDIDGVAVTRAPGLIGALLVGLSAAKAVAYSKKIPFIGVNHLEGHVNAMHLTREKIEYPHIALLVSGGHTSLYLVKKFGDYKLLGATRDDAAGEAFDKVARLLGLGYPGGPIIDALAPKGDENIFKFKPPKFTNQSEYDFSFSGIKTAVMMHYKSLSNGGLIKERDMLNLVASFQRAAIQMLVKQVVKAAKGHRCGQILVAGGVAANKGLRARLKKITADEGLNISVPPLELCTDNAAMIAFVGGEYLKLGKRDDLNLNAAAVEEIGT